MTDSGHEGLWVHSDPLPGGGYGVTVGSGEDRAWPLTRMQALAYAAVATRRYVEAEHDAAVFAFLRRIPGLGDEGAALTLQEIRDAREVDDTATEPLRFAPGVNADGRPFVTVLLDGKPTGQVDPAALAHHAGAVLEVLAAADLDSDLQVHLRGMGLDEATARRGIAQLGDYWPDRA